MKRRYVDFINRARKHFYPAMETLNDAQKEQAKLRELDEYNLIEAMIPKNGSSKHLHVYRDLFPEDQANPVVAAFAVFCKKENIDFIPQKLKEDYDFAKFLLRSDGYLLKSLPNNIKSDVDCCTISMNATDGRTIQYVSDELKDNREWAVLAVTSFGDNYQFLLDKFKEDRYIAMMAVQEDGKDFRHLIPQFQKEQAIAEMAVISNGLALEYLPDEFKDKDEIVKLTTPPPFTNTFHVFTLKLASPRIQRNSAFLVNFFKGMPLATEIFIRVDLENELKIVHDFKEALNLESQATIVRIMGMMDLSKRDIVKNPELAKTLGKSNDECIELLTTRLSVENLNPKRWNHPYLKMKAQEELDRRKLMNVRHKLVSSKPKTSRKLSLS